MIRTCHRYGNLTGTGIVLALFASCVFTLAACSPGADLPKLPPAATGPYLLGPGDQIRMITFGDATLTGTFSVDESGRISLPLLGPVKATGLSTAELQTDIGDALKNRKLFNNPSVVIEVATRRPVFVLGEVQKPGGFPFEPDMTVRSAVALAGGYTYRAYKDRVEIVRKTEDGRVTGQASPDAPLQAGDEVTVLERHF